MTTAVFFDERLTLFSQRKANKKLIIYIAFSLIVFNPNLQRDVVVEYRSPLMINILFLINFLLFVCTVTLVTNTLFLISFLLLVSNSKLMMNYNLFDILFPPKSYNTHHLLKTNLNLKLLLIAPRF